MFIVAVDALVLPGEVCRWTWMGAQKSWDFRRKDKTLCSLIQPQNQQRVIATGDPQCR